MGRIDISHLWELVIEPAEVRAYLWIADRAAGIEFTLHVVAQFNADICQWVFITKAPYQYRRVVLVTSDGGLCPLLKYWVEGRV